MDALRNLGLLYTPAEERFDRITRLATRLLGVPTARISLVADDEQWFKSAQGIDAVSTPRDVSFCGHAVQDERTLIVEDALQDPRFADNPLVTDHPKIRFYAGEPVRVDGYCVGTLCVLDTKPHEFSQGDREVLKDLASLVEVEFERKELSQSQAVLIAERGELLRRTSVDGLTRLWNRNAILDLMAKEVARANRGGNVTVAMVDVDKFKEINDTYGHMAGDKVLVELSARLRRSVREFDCVGRFGGDEFVVVLSGCGPEGARAGMDRVLDGVGSQKIEFGEVSLPVTVSIGYASHSSRMRDPAQLLEAADWAMYRAKTEGRNRAVAYSTL